jgi:hypothetical protein
MLRAIPIVLLAALLGGCVAAVPAGEPVYEPPAVVEEPSVSVFAWFPWPHYEVDHHYVVDNDRVVIHDRHYFPTYGRTRTYIRNDNGKHPGYYKHEKR